MCRVSRSVAFTARLRIAAGESLLALPMGINVVPAAPAAEMKAPDGGFGGQSALARPKRRFVKVCSVRVASSDSCSPIRRRTGYTELTRLSHSRALGIPIREDHGLAKRPRPRSRWRPPLGIESPDCLRGMPP